MAATVSEFRSGSPVAPEGEAREWFAVYVTPRHEKRVAEHFEVRQIEHFLPLYETMRRWKDGSKVTLQLPLFPSYTFVRIARTRRTPVLEVPGVLSIVGTRRDASPIAESYVHFLRDGLMLGKIQPHSYLATGSRVRVKSGVMAGIEGVLIRKKGSFRVVITLELIMKSVSVEVDVDDLEPVGAMPPGRTSGPATMRGEFAV